MTIAIAAALSAFIFIKVLRLPERFKLRKPFNCMLCLSFWLSIAFYFTPEYITNFVFITTLAASLGAWAEKF